MYTSACCCMQSAPPASLTDDQVSVFNLWNLWLLPEQIPLRAIRTPYILLTLYPASPAACVLLCFTEFSKQIGAGEDNHPEPLLHHGEIWG